MKNAAIVRREAPSFPVSILIAGSISRAEDACRRYCFEHGACVTLTPTTYVYTGGAETGLIVGLINYPRFPKDPEALMAQAATLAEFLMDELCQGSCTVQGPELTVWMSRRGD
jgi:hypothetical protein